MPKISVIVPVYHVEPYIKKCVDSILNQTFRDFEVILIDDGSPDGCPEICDEYARVDPRISVIHQKNQGVSIARNAGLDIATGQLITFVDPDDYLEPDAYKTTIDRMEQTGCEVGIFSSIMEDENGNVIREYACVDATVDRYQLIKRLFDLPISIRGVVFNKIFSRESIGHIRFSPNLKIDEDREFVYHCFLRVDKAVILHNVFYHNYCRMGSATLGGTSASYYLAVHDLRQKITADIKTRYPDMYSYAYLFYVCMGILDYYNKIKSRLKTAGKNERKEWTDAFKVMRKTLREEAPKVLVCKEVPFRIKAGYMLRLVYLR